MRKIIIIITLLLLITPLLTITPVLAAGEVTFDADTTISLTNPAVDLVVQSGSVIDSLTINAGSIAVTISTNGSFIVSSSDRKSMTFNSTQITRYTDYVCNDSQSQMSVAPGSTDGLTFTITVTNDTCSVASGMSGGGGGGGGGGPSTTQTKRTTIITEEPSTTLEETPTAEPIVLEIPGVPATDRAGDVTLEQMTADAEVTVSGDVNQVTAKMGVARDTTAETTYDADIVTRVVADTEITAAARSTIVNFVTYGTPATKVLGAGERGGVVNSFKAAFGKLPATTEEWNDVVKIANGRWPSVTSETAETRSKITFKTIYLREADMNDAHDNAAVTVMAYGLRPAARNLDSERAAIRTFKAIYKYIPESATNWDAVRAIAYSGATR